MKIVDNHIPLKQLSRKTIKNMAKPWITPGIRASLKIKNNFYKRYINTRYRPRIIFQNSNYIEID